MDQHSRTKVQQYQETLSELAQRNENIQKEIAEDQKWIKDAEAEQTKRLARIDRNSQELWETKGQMKILNEWIVKEEATATA